MEVWIKRKQLIFFFVLENVYWQRRVTKTIRFNIKMKRMSQIAAEFKFLKNKDFNKNNIGIIQ